MKLVALLSKHRILGSSVGLHFWSKIKTDNNVLLRTVNLFSTSSFRNSSREVVFLGSDSFATPSLLALVKYFGSDSVTVVVSNEKNTIGNLAKKLSVNTVVWEDFKDEKAQDTRNGGENKAKYYLGVVASFGHLIPENVINRFQEGIFNVHPSLLPKYRGAAPINHAIMNGDSATGVSIMKIAAHKFDVGPLYKVITVPINPHVRAPELSKILAETGAEILTEVFADLEQNSQNLINQQDKKASHAKKLTRSMANVNWNIHSSGEIYNLFRGLYGSHDLKTTYDGKEVNLRELGLLRVGPNSENNLSSNVQEFKAKVSTDFSNFYPSPVVWNVSSLPENVLPGHVIYKNSVLCVKCKSINNTQQNYDWIFVRKVKVGLKWMSAQDFENGFLKKGKKRGVHKFEFVRDPNVVPKLKTIRAFKQ